jgi:hypothetical protein
MDDFDRKIPHRDHVSCLRYVMDLSDIHWGCQLRFTVRKHLYQRWLNKPFQILIHDRLNQDSFYIKAGVLERGRRPRRLREI